MKSRAFHSPFIILHLGYNDPFVLGTSEFRGSADTACRSALAVALKIASAMW